jgi:hypothetical protein
MDLELIATKWIDAASEHRKASGVRGRVGVTIMDSAVAPKELHLIEETVFYAGPGKGQYRDPLAAAMDWVRKSAKNRRENGANGTIRIETNDKNGIVTIAKVIETTVIISTAPLDAPIP